MLVSECKGVIDMTNEKGVGHCITRRGLIKIGLGMACAGLVSTMTGGSAQPAFATGVGEDVYVTGDYEIVDWREFPDGFTKHTDGNTGELVFCIEHGRTNGTGSAHTEGLLGKTVSYLNGGPQYRTWTQDAITEVAIIVEGALAGAFGGATEDERYVRAQAAVWRYMEDWGYQNSAAWEDAVPTWMRPWVSGIKAYVDERIGRYVGHGMLYGKDNGDQQIGRFWTTPATGHVTGGPDGLKVAAHKDWL